MGLPSVHLVSHRWLIKSGMEEIDLGVFGTILGYFFAGGLLLGAVIVVYELVFRRKPVTEPRGWYAEERVVRREDRSIIYQGDPDDPVVERRRH